MWQNSRTGRTERQDCVCTCVKCAESMQCAAGIVHIAWNLPMVIYLH